VRLLLLIEPASLQYGGADVKSGTFNLHADLLTSAVRAAPPPSYEFLMGDAEAGLTTGLFDFSEYMQPSG
jgi:hypothetical protein